MNAAVLCLFLCWMTLATAQIPCAQSVTYDVTAQCNWTAITHPRDYPTVFPHFSSMCGTVHSAGYQMWAIQGLASPGVKSIAETGHCGIFEDEVKECETSGYCYPNGKFSWDCSPNANDFGVCTFSGLVTVSNDYRRVSMLSMLAPSPDWVVGLDSIDLCQTDAETGAAFWMEQYPNSGAFSLYPIDAGTDGGATYASANQPLTEPELIKFFDVNDTSSIFYNSAMNAMLPICEIKISLKP